ncbi:hypothetical protein [Ostreiculturibacter nitratireducens]|uniref:hypothetical protein n=1 Tax=Ostreiculturibacter nitratireducens TaxID=3075226 RepID=UPI0031B5B1EE
MKPGFALNLSHDGIGLLRRTGHGWVQVGEVSLEDPKLGEKLSGLRDAAASLAPSGMATKLIIPNSQILYTEIEAPGPSAASRRGAIRKALEGRTPYAVSDLVFDWSGTGRVVQVAVVARVTLEEAETFAEQYGFAPVSFVAIPDDGTFRGEPFFGAASRSADHLPEGARLDRDQDPVRIVGHDEKEPEPTSAPPAAAAEDAEPPEERPSDEQDESAVETVASEVEEKVGSDRTEEIDVTEVQETAEAASEAAAAEPEASPPVTEAAEASALPEPVMDTSKLTDEAEAPEESSEATAGTISPEAEVEKPEPAAQSTEAVEKTEVPEQAEEAPEAEEEPAATLEPALEETSESAEPTETAEPVSEPEEVEEAPTASREETTSDVVQEAETPGTEAAGQETTPSADAEGPEKAPEAEAELAWHSRFQIGQITPERAAEISEADADEGAAAVEPPPAPAAADGAGSPDIAFVSRRVGVPDAQTPDTEDGKAPAIGSATAEADGPKPKLGSAVKPGEPGFVVGGRVTGLPDAVRPGARKGDLPGAPGERDPVGKSAARQLRTWIEGRKRARAGTAAPVAAAKASKASSATKPGEAERPGVFGTPPAAKKRPAKSNRLGLSLIAGLLFLMAAVALWSSFFGAQDQAPIVVSEAPSETASAPPDLATPPQEAISEPAPPSMPEVASEPAATVDADTTVPDVAPLEEALASAPADDTAPAVPGETARPEAEAPEAPLPATPVWIGAPEQPDKLAPGARTAIAPIPPDTGPVERQTTPLPESVNVAIGPSPAAPPFGTVTGPEGEDLVEPTPEGTLMPEGFALYAGQPDTVPPARPEAIEAAAQQTATEPDPLEGKRPRARPAGIAPEPPAEPAGTEDDAAAEQPSETVVAESTFAADPALAGKTPRSRPASVVAAAEAAQAAADRAAAEIEEASALAVASSRRPAVRPPNFTRAVDAAVAAAVAASQPEAEVTAAAAPAPEVEIDEPEPEAAAPDIPTRASVAKQATVTNAIKLNQVNLIGVYGSSANRRALVRLGNGKFVKVQIGDRLDGGKVVAITDRQLSYTKGSRTIVLEMPKDG